MNADVDVTAALEVLAMRIGEGVVQLEVAKLQIEQLQDINRGLAQRVNALTTTLKLLGYQEDQNGDLIQVEP